MLPTEYYKTIRRNPNLVCYWRMGGSDLTGTIAHDFAGKFNLNGIYNGSPLSKTSLITPVGNETEYFAPGSKKFGEATQSMEIPNAEPLQITGGITVEAWIAPLKIGEYVILSKTKESIASPYLVGMKENKLYYTGGNGTTQTTIEPEKKSQNLVFNPGFEYDAVGGAPAWWEFQNVFTTKKVEEGWSASGKKSLRVTTPNDAIEHNLLRLSIPSPVVGSHVALKAVINVLTLESPKKITFIIEYYNAEHHEISNTQKSTTATGIQTIEVNGIVPEGTTEIRLYPLNIHGASGVADLYIDNIQFVETSKIFSYFDGDSAGWHWNGTPGNSISEEGYVETGSTHVVATIFRNNVFLYVNGKIIATDTLEAQEIKDSGKPVFVGALESNAQRFNGLIGEVALYNAAMSAQTAKEHFAIGRQILYKKPYYTNYDRPSYS